MKKLINGKEVDIDIALFEKAAEDMVAGRKAESDIQTYDDSLDTKKINELIELYNKFSNSLPYPLNYIDNNVRYCVTGLIIKKMTKNRYKIAVKGGLLIAVGVQQDSERFGRDKVYNCLHFVNRSWGIIPANESDLDERSLDLQEYKFDTGFKQMVWVATKWLKGEGTKDFYKEQMKEFTRACNGEEVVMKYELSNMLEIGEAPNERMNITDNMVVDISSGTTYYLDIYLAGKREDKSASGTKTTWNLITGEQRDSYKQVRIYEYNLYKKDNNIDRKNELSKVSDNKFGLTALFLKLNSIRVVERRNEFPVFHGVICGEYLVFEIEGRVYCTGLNKPSQTMEIASGMEIYSVNKDRCFIFRSSRIQGNARKHKIYSIDCKDGTVKLCRIAFVNG